MHMYTRPGLFFRGAEKISKKANTGTLATLLRFMCFYVISLIYIPYHLLHKP